jgi:hypothetical protein
MFPWLPAGWKKPSNQAVHYNITFFITISCSPAEYPFHYIPPIALRFPETFIAQSSSINIAPYFAATEAAFQAWLPPLVWN